MKKYTLTKTSQSVHNAVDKLVDFVKITYGANGKKVIMFINPSFQAVDDGVTIAREFELPDEFENSIISLIKQVAVRTNSRVGDGTTTSLILLQALLHEIKKQKVTEFAPIAKAVEEAVAYIKKHAKQVTTKEQLKAIALNSYNNEKMAEVISNVLFQMGKDGIITIEESGDSQTHHEVVQGFRFDKGYFHNSMINVPERMEAHLSNALVFVTDKKITNLPEIVKILEAAISTGKKELLIVCEAIEGEALGTVIVNHLRGIIHTVCVPTPGYGSHKIENCQDIATLTGSGFFSEASARKLETITPSDFGKCARIIVDQEKTTLVGGAGSHEALQARIAQLREYLNLSEYQREQDKIRDQIARLTSGIAVIRVGANTEAELKSVKFKVEDAVNSTQLAFREGVIEGGGVTFKTIKTSSPVLNAALKYPRKQLEANGKEFITKGVIDPAGVLIASLESAASIAGILHDSAGILVEEKVEAKS